MKSQVLILFHFLLFHAGRGQMMGGLPAGPRQFPFAVMVLGGRYLCGGSIIGHQWVITAGHCVRRNRTNMITTIVAGEEFLREEDQNEDRRITISNDQIEIIPHLNFDDNEYDNDVALLFLRTPLKPSRHVKMIELGSNNGLRAGDECTVMGWGKTKVKWGPPGNHSNHIQSENSRFLKYGKRIVDVVHNELILFLNQSRDGYSPYMLGGDSGSPLVCRDTDEKQKLFGWQVGIDLDRNDASYKPVKSVRFWIGTRMREKWLNDELICDKYDLIRQVFNRKA